MTHSLDGLSPSSIERPESLDELSASLAQTSGQGQAVVPWGGGTRINIGNIPSRYDVALDLASFEGQTEHEPGDMTVVANAGVKIADLSSSLAAEGQRLPFEVRNASSATVGGSVASNASGHRQSSTGGIRDWVIGMQTVLPDGTVTKSGGRVVKNVQGYEMHRLNTGAFGTLGVISQVAFKLLPVPIEQQTIIAWFDDRKSAEEVGMSFVNGLFVPEAITLLSGPIAATVIRDSGESVDSDSVFALLLRVGGGVRAVERQVNDVVGAVGTHGATGYAVLNENSAVAAWQKLEADETNASLSARFISRTSTALSASRAVEEHPEISQTAAVSSVTDLGFGSTTLLTNPGDADAALQVATALVGELKRNPGSYVIESAPTSVKQAMDVFSNVGASLELMRRIKAEYDPNNTLNPGRFAGKI